MHGNVFQWWRDEFGSYSLPVNPGDGERQPSGMGLWTIRGGSFRLRASSCRSAARFPVHPGSGDGSWGFRVAAPLP